MVLQARLGSRPAYGRVATATVTASYHAIRGANPGRHDPFDGHHDQCGDGDKDGMDMPCWMLHRGGTASVAVSSGRHSYSAVRSYSGGGYYSGGTPGGAFGRCVVARESGGNSQVMNSSGHYGLYQFSASTWRAYGGSSSTFGHASVAEQNRVFANALAQGGQSNWSPYDGC